METEQKAAPFLSIGVTDPVLRIALATSIRAWGIQGITVSEDPDQADLGIESVERKVRLGTVMDWILTRASQKQGAHPDVVVLPSGVLDPRRQIFTPKSGDPLRFSARERDLMMYLYASPTRTRTRTEILGDIWGYVPDLETHTLETHVYRLRQKIEENPTDPKILGTIEGGYALYLDEQA